MDKYFKSIAVKYLYKMGYEGSPEFMELLLKSHLRNLPHDFDMWAHWFYNCRMFHESPCEECEYRFRCYTN